MTIGIVLSLIILMCGISEYFRLQVIAAGVREAVEDAVISTVNDLSLIHIYIKVYEGASDTNDLEELYDKFRYHPPSGYTGHGLSISDVLELYDETGSSFFYVDRYDFKRIDFTESQPAAMKAKTWRQRQSDVPFQNPILREDWLLHIPNLQQSYYIFL